MEEKFYLAAIAPLEREENLYSGEPDKLHHFLKVLSQ